VFFALRPLNPGFNRSNPPDRSNRNLTIFCTFCPDRDGTMRSRRKTHRLRIFFCTALFLALAGGPLLLGLTRPSPEAASSVPMMAGVYASGLTSLGLAGLVSIPLAAIFSLWLIAGQRNEVNRRWLQQSSRDRRNFVETARTLAILLGAAGIIIGSLAGLYATLTTLRPELYAMLPMPFLTFQNAIPAVILGGLLYSVGRIAR
jgi:hypothetical protein